MDRKKDRRAGEVFSGRFLLLVFGLAVAAQAIAQQDFTDWSAAQLGFKIATAGVAAFAVVFLWRAARLFWMIVGGWRVPTPTSGFDRWDDFDLGVIDPAGERLERGDQRLTKKRHPAR